MLLLLVSLAVAAIALGDANREGERYVSAPWTPIGDDAQRPAGRKIHIRYSFGGYACQYRLHSVTARQTEDDVTIKVLAHRREMRQDEACAAIQGGGTSVVKLRRALGDRELKHAPVNDSVVIDTFP